MKRHSNHRGVSDATSAYRRHRGLFWRGWQARITANGVTHYLGDFNTEEEAALAYNEAAQRLHAKPKLNAIAAPIPTDLPSVYVALGLMGGFLVLTLLRLAMGGWG